MPTSTLLLRLLSALLLRSLHLRLRLLRGLALRLPLRLLSALLVRLVFAAAPAAPVSLRLSLPVGLDRPRL